MKKKILVVLLVLIFLYCIGGVIYSVFVSQNNANEKSLSKIVEINNFEYKIDEKRESSLYKKEFNLLKSNLESNSINIEEYIQSIAKLYIIDLYSLSTKNNKYDVTTSQYVKESIRENFKLKVSETIYKYIEDKNTDNREQELPLVSEVFIKSKENNVYLLDNTEYESYIVNIEWLYNKDLGYDTSATLTLIKEGSIVSVVEEKRIVEENIEETDEIKNS